MHIGHNISRIRNFRGIKQTDMASRLKMSQQNYSLIERSEKIKEEVLRKISYELECEIDFIKKTPNDFHILEHTIKSDLINSNLNPLEKIIELYERLIETEKEKNKLLERLQKHVLNH